ncbi:hypothetical protein GcM1_241065 [Golovinomyces cichoracearum]|uniref:Uncharacterized protein n=1 Tax=Golovinomyces cichoracearum TaxID=62708 RepID=A0A420IHL7_9PEZI|nr:hypothetical protein GcM1_241065 [Golovinomyces cichoracearum]
MVEHLHKCYEGIDYKRSELQALNAISCKSIREQNLTKLPSKCVTILVDTLNAKRRGLDAFQRTDDAIAPSPQLSTFINQLKMAVSNYHTIKEDAPAAAYMAESNYEDEYGNSEVNFTNRRFKEDFRGRGAYRGGYRQRDLSSKGSPGDSRGMKKHKQSLYNSRNKCYVCEQKG